MKERLKQELDSLEEAITLMEVNDHASTRAYSKLIKKRRIIRRTLKRIERIEK
jgi:hypothetical protein